MPSGTPEFEKADPSIGLGAPPQVAEMPSWLTNVIEGPTPIGFLSRGLGAIGGLVFSKPADSAPVSSRPLGSQGAEDRAELFEPYGRIDNIPKEYRADRRFVSLSLDADRGNKPSATGNREAITALEAEYQGLVSAEATRAPGGATLIFMMELGHRLT
ncbi:hypothetical protein GNX71_01235 [Variovorax sp. RKNM96]|uniref:hypothetical protein n=1 Tax=Variovorax sp. RKNM96 TaxID=2681552 RepID=UPI0019813E40|nr:hypothetical protein [Variovorax sp. RKNM96]QSI28272.1 hypothetical protein GNX71_01235 [Variovorax sp. RKNM96]